MERLRSPFSSKMHDDAVWNTLATLLGGVPPREAAQARARRAPGCAWGIGLAVCDAYSASGVLGGLGGRASNHSRVQLSPMGRPFAWPRDASMPHTRSRVRVAHSASWFWVLRWAGPGMMARSDSCATSSVSALSAPRQLSAVPRRQLGRVGGVVCWQWLCSRQLPAQRWAHMDRSWQRALPETRLARTWTSCCTSRQRRGLAACRCGRRRAS